mmetsp:Transcript_10016/g.10126  ORF Transcript_10016/g.10126 Transcript_10016/m.10126 type:complete len:179 (+) Transcript_10016:194-730(+)|eukprot:CAMPEP_0182430708 /NCGR_PEP_ID=MMETSP1167-20130531/42758_1 /TAXON_ID=2988 /ORGANISM="Mallomonas Sp, Strain CCMP3275" /LENGTH=178 /DNA_ID=CAMNT_0024616115 /DNA_START=128 /DNA_END=664 /DNA_ORIENTATION=+
MDESGIYMLNQLPLSDVRNGFLRCCGSQKFAEGLAEKLPFRSVEFLLAEAHSLWWVLKESEWRMAFEAHPRIGDKEALRKKFAHSEWEKSEQSGAENASNDVIQQLEQWNIEYEAKFGYVFLICATGKSAEDMLNSLLERYPNDPDTEIRIAASEQEKITRLRLLKFLSSLSITSSRL